MPRSARARAESGFYHVIQKGNGGQTLFEDAQDYRAYLDFLSNKSADNGISVLAYCLMSNHVHLLLRDPDGRLSEMMHALTTSYAQHFNKRGGAHRPRIPAALQEQGDRGRRLPAPGASLHPQQPGQGRRLFRARVLLEQL